MKGYIKKLLREGLNHTLHKNYEGYHNDINQLIPNIEKKYNLKRVRKKNKKWIGSITSCTTFTPRCSN